MYRAVLDRKLEAASRAIVDHRQRIPTHPGPADVSAELSVSSHRFSFGNRWQRDPTIAVGSQSNASVFNVCPATTATCPVLPFRTCAKGARPLLTRPFRQHAADQRGLFAPRAVFRTQWPRSLAPCRKSAQPARPRRSDSRANPQQAQGCCSNGLVRRECLALTCYRRRIFAGSLLPSLRLGRLFGELSI